MKAGRVEAWIWRMPEAIILEYMLCPYFVSSCVVSVIHVSLFSTHRYHFGPQLAIGVKPIALEGTSERRAIFRAFPPSHARLTSTPNRIIASWPGTCLVLRVFNPFFVLVCLGSLVVCGFRVENTGK